MHKRISYHLPVWESS